MGLLGSVIRHPRKQFSEENTCVDEIPSALRTYVTLFGRFPEL
jgi:hypothetical protein